MPTPYEDIDWDSKYEKWGKPTHQQLIGDRPTSRPGESDGETQDASRFDAIEEFNNDYDVRQFMSYNPDVVAALPNGVVENYGDMNFIRRAMEKFHSKPTELGGMGNGGAFSSDRDYAGVAQESMEKYLDKYIKQPDEVVDDMIEENVPDPWWKEEDPEREEDLKKAEDIVTDRNNRGLASWSGDKYDARKNEDDDMNDPGKEGIAMEFNNNFKRNLLNNMHSSVAVT